MYDPAAVLRWSHCVFAHWRKSWDRSCSLFHFFINNNIINFHSFHFFLTILFFYTVILITFLNCLSTRPYLCVCVCVWLFVRSYVVDLYILLTFQYRIIVNGWRIGFQRNRRRLLGRRRRTVLLIVVKCDRIEKDLVVCPSVLNKLSTDEIRQCSCYLDVWLRVCVSVRGARYRFLDDNDEEDKASDCCRCFGEHYEYVVILTN